MPVQDRGKFTEADIRGMLAKLRAIQTRMEAVADAMKPSESIPKGIESFTANYRARTAAALNNLRDFATECETAVEDVIDEVHGFGSPAPPDPTRAVRKRTGGGKKTK